MFDFKGDSKMKTLRKLSVMVGAIVVVAMMAATANAGCGDIGHGKATLKRQAWASEFGSPALRLVSEQDNDPITGLWKVTLMAGKTKTASAILAWTGEGGGMNN